MATFVGTSGDDIFTGDDSADIADGNGGNDELSGNGGADSLAGGAGADVVNGGDGDDTLYSGIRSPTFNLPYYNNPFTFPVLDTGAEVDTLRGGAGADRLFAGYGDNVDGGENGYSGDYLYISFLGAPSGVTADFRQTTLIIGGGTITNIENISYVQGSDFDDDLNVATSYFGGYSDFGSVLGMGGNDRLTAGYYTGSLFGGDGNDVVDGRSSQYLNRVDGGDGDDTLYTSSNGFGAAYGGNGNDTIYSHGETYGGAGNDLIVLQQTYYAASVYGDGGDDEIRAALNGNTIIGGAGADLLIGNTGADTLFSGELAVFTSVDTASDTGLDYDRLSGGDGDDLLIAGYGDDVDGGSGADTLRYSLAGLTSGVTLDTSGFTSGQPFTYGGGTIRNIETFARLTGTAFADTINVATQSTRLTVDAGAGDDTVTTNRSSVTFNGGAGDDTLISGPAGDTFDGGAGLDTVDYRNATVGLTVSLGLTPGASGIGGGGEQLLNVEAVSGSAFGDTISGSNAAERLVGNGGDDILNGNGGGDTLDGGSGNDRLNGGTGAVSLKGGDGDDVIAFLQASSAPSSTNGVIDGGTGTDTLDFSQIGPVSYSREAVIIGAQQFSIAGIETVLLGAGADQITIGGGVSPGTEVRGGAGNDQFTISGDIGRLFGDAGDDTFHIASLGRLSNWSGAIDGGAGVNTLRVQSQATVDLRDGSYLAGGTSYALSNIQNVNVVIDGTMTVTTVRGTDGANVISANAGNNAGMVFDGRGGDDTLIGGAGADRLTGGTGNDAMTGGAGLDTAVFAGARADYKLVYMGGDQVRVSGPDGTDMLTGVERLQFGDGTVAAPTSFFDPVVQASGNFGRSPGGGGWSSANTYPRAVADVNGDGRADVVGFGVAGAYTALGRGDGTFGDVRLAVSQFGAGAEGGDWVSQDRYPRVLADVNGDGRADVVGFGLAGTYTGLGRADGTFGALTLAVRQFGAGAEGGNWTSQDRYPRTLADVNGDGRADIVGFGEAGAYVALGRTDGTFGDLTLAIGNYGTGAGGWTSQDRYPRAVADVNGDGRADIVAFGEPGTYISPGRADGTFGAPSLAVAQFGAGAAGGGWTSQGQYPRTVADVNGDGATDLVGFGVAGTYVALNDGQGRFAAPVLAMEVFGAGPGAGGWSSNDLYPRALADVNGDGRADIIGFGENGVFVATADAFDLVAAGAGTAAAGVPEAEPALDLFHGLGQAGDLGLFSVEVPMFAFA